MKKKKVWVTLLAVVAGFCLITGLISGVIVSVAANTDFYLKEYEKLGTAKDIGISEEELSQATVALLDYTVDKRDDMVSYANIRGEYREVFNEREKAHMVDVKALFLGARTLTYILFGIAAAGLLVLILVKAEVKAALKGYLIANWIFLGVFALLVCYAAIDFNSFWISFHHVFFTNDLWLLDPSTCILIQMVPEQFFFDLVFTIIAIFAAMFLILLVGTFIWLRAIGKKERMLHALQN